KLGVFYKVPSEQSSRFLTEAPEPLQPHPLKNSGRPPDMAGYKIKGCSYTYRNGNVIGLIMIENPLLLFRGSYPDEQNIGFRLLQHLHNLLVFFFVLLESVAR